MPTSRRAAARTASESVAEQIRGQIANGTLKPGDMLPSETALLEIYEVARPTMREALRILESDGLVSILRGASGGARVREPDLASLARRAGLHLQLHDTHLAALTEAQRIIQPGAVALAATRRNPAALERLRDCVEDISACSDLECFADLAADFLRLLVEASGNQALSLFSNLVDKLLHEELRSYLHNRAQGQEADFIGWAVDQYETLLELIEEGDADGAAAFWREHLKVSELPDSPDGVSARLEVYPSRRRRRGPVTRRGA